MRAHLEKALVAAMGAALNAFVAGFSIGSQNGLWLLAVLCATGALAGIASCWLHINSALAGAPR